jgi:hypothetical protein
LKHCSEANSCGILLHVYDLFVYDSCSLKFNFVNRSFPTHSALVSACLLSLASGRLLYSTWNFGFDQMVDMYESRACKKSGEPTRKYKSIFQKSVFEVTH